MWGTKTIARLKWHLKELAKTFSNEKSHYSSKRIERAFIFMNANIMLDLLVLYLTFKGKLDAMDAIGFYTVQMLYAGYQTKQIAKDPKPEPEN